MLEMEEAATELRRSNSAKVKSSNAMRSAPIAPSAPSFVLLRFSFIAPMSDARSRTLEEAELMEEPAESRPCAAAKKPPDVSRSCVAEAERLEGALAFGIMSASMSKDEDIDCIESAVEDVKSA